jgi:hypothetical protein
MGSEIYMEAVADPSHPGLWVVLANFSYGFWGVLLFFCYHTYLVENE